jgi:hypothetical protein
MPLKTMVQPCDGNADARRQGQKRARTPNKMMTTPQPIEATAACLKMPVVLCASSALPAAELCSSLSSAPLSTINSAALVAKRAALRHYSYGVLKDSTRMPNVMGDFQIPQGSVAYEWRRRLLRPQTRSFPYAQRNTCACPLSTSSIPLKINWK